MSKIEVKLTFLSPLPAMTNSPGLVALEVIQGMNSMNKPVTTRVVAMPISWILAVNAF